LGALLITTDHYYKINKPLKSFPLVLLATIGEKFNPKETPSILSLRERLKPKTAQYQPF
jgi:hypothetical protein